MKNSDCRILIVRALEVFLCVLFFDSQWHEGARCPQGWWFKEIVGSMWNEWVEGGGAYDHGNCIIDCPIQDALKMKVWQKNWIALRKPDLWHGWCTSDYGSAWLAFRFSGYRVADIPPAWCSWPANLLYICMERQTDGTHVHAHTHEARSSRALRSVWRGPFLSSCYF